MCIFGFDRPIAGSLAAVKSRSAGYAMVDAPVAWPANFDVTGDSAA